MDTIINPFSSNHTISINMKNLIFFATLLIFILNISAKDDVPDPVLDTDGDELKTGTGYYVDSVIQPGGGVTVYPTDTCTFGIIQLEPSIDGLPVIFANGGTDLGEVVRESTDIMITFYFEMFVCPGPWRVDEYDDVAKQCFITAGGSDGNQTSNNIWFQIRKDPTSLDSYRFVFCPKVCEFCAQICTDVGLYIRYGYRRFVLGGNIPSNIFRFKKYEPRTNSNGLEA